MKNTLLTTTAIALTSFAGAANAVEVTTGAVTMQITGFFRTTAAITSVDTDDSSEDFDGFDILTNSEVHFKPAITLDNGITVGADIELEGNTTGDQIDESTIFFKGDFGKVELGSKDSAGKQMQIGAPDVSMVYSNSTSLSAFVPFTSDGGSYPTTFRDFANDADRITYFSPDFSGFQFGASYARNNSQTNGPVDNDAQTADYVDIGASYSGSMGGMDLGLSARWGAASSPSGADPELWAVGLSLGFGDFSIGGGYLEMEGGDAHDGLDGEETYSAWDIGASYTMGQMGYSLTYTEAENPDNLLGGSDFVGASESSVLVAAATYKVNSNFKIGVSISDVELDVAGGSDDDVDGTVLAVSAQFNF